MSGMKARIKEKIERHWREYPGSAKFWEDLREDVEYGKFPHPDAISKAVLTGRPIPPWALPYVAGTVKRPRGCSTSWSTVGFGFGEALQKAKHSEIALEMNALHRRLLAVLVFDYELLYEDPEYQRDKEKQHRRKLGRILHPQTPYDEALATVAKLAKLDVGTIASYCRTYRVMGNR